MKRVPLEFWADSFHEGFWACDQLSQFYPMKNIKFLKNFIPVFLYEISKEIELEITVLGSYANWSPLPQAIADLISWGKPDLVVYDPEGKKILFAMEETAAVPTGNQALQRCERMYGSSRYRIPFWYLLGEFGMHVDGGVRRDSIWPTVLAIKLSCIQRCPCVVLHYSDLEHPEDYSFGTGVNSLWMALSVVIGISFGIKRNEDLLPILAKQYNNMLSFIKSQWEQVVSFIPRAEMLDDPSTAKQIAELVLSGRKTDNSLLDFFNWERTNTIPKRIYNMITPGGIIKNDPFVLGLEKIVGAKRAYNLSSNAGSRPQPKDDIIDWIKQQKALLKTNTATDVVCPLRIDDFPASKTGHHVTTAKNVFYLVDYWTDVEKALKKAFPRLKNFSVKEDGPAFVYISNSLKPGRIFGDPFTGQLSAFANIFTKNVLGNRTRISLAYYPHQVHTQLFKDNTGFKSNKGILMMRELLDFAVFCGGAVVNMKTGEVI
jgi:hypothetical protein